MRIIDMPEFKDKSQVLSFDEETKLSDAIKEMATKNYGACLITKNEKLVGIFTERDLLRKVAPENMDTKKTLLKDVMTKALKTAKVTDEVDDCLRRMSQGRFRHMPVVDDKKNILGMLSQGDFVAFTMSDVMERMRKSAHASVAAGRGTPVSIILAIVVYTLGLLFIISALNHWFGL